MSEQQDKPPVVERRRDGTIKRGSANPGGQPKEVKKFRDLLKGLHPQTASVARKVLRRARDTSALDRIVEDGEASPEARLDAEAQVNARLKLGVQMVAEVWKYSLPKPQSRVKVSGQLSNPIGELSTEDIQALIRATKGEGK